MQTARFYCPIIWAVWCFLQVIAKDYIKLSHNGPVVLGGTITFKADLYGKDGERPRGTFRYKWTDNLPMKHKYQTEKTSNVTTVWSINYTRDDNTPGNYMVEVEVDYLSMAFFWIFDARAYIEFEISEYLNGNITIEQGNKTIIDEYVSSAYETDLTIDIRKGDYNYIIQKAKTISTYWFIDCKYYGQTNNFVFAYNFTTTDVTHEIGTLVIASYNLQTITSVLPYTTTVISINMTTIVPNITIANSNGAHIEHATSTTLPITIANVKPSVKSTTVTSSVDRNMMDTTNMSLSNICSNTIIPPDPNKTYGYFRKKIHIRAPVSNISVEGTNWIQPWDMLSLNVTCKGSGPFSKCLQFHRGKYNVTGNETCNNVEHLHSCNFSIVHYFLEPSVYTILIILNNEVNTQIYPLTINIYKVTTKPQLSVIIVPVSCSLVAVVLIVFGVAYYIQSRARFTIEVADFDFGQSNPEMEYKTFTERLRDSFNNTGYKPLNNPGTLQ